MLDKFFKSEEGARWLADNMVVGRAALREFVSWLENQAVEHGVQRTAESVEYYCRCPKCGAEGEVALFSRRR